MKFATRNVVSSKVMSPTEAAYLAGFVDGEGTISLSRARRKENRAGFRYQPCFQFAQARRSALRRIIRLCGNGRLVVATVPKGPHQKQGYNVRFQPNQIRHVLPQILPYLIVKRTQAKLLLRALDILPTGANYTPESWSAIQQIRHQLRQLNQRGQFRRLDPEGPPVLAPRKYTPVLERSGQGAATCSVSDCGRPAKTRSYCRRHYKLFIERGGPTAHDKRCARCDRGFISKRNDARFCSKRCAGGEYQRPSRARGEITKTCARCGRQFQAQRVTAQFCSNNCRCSDYQRRQRQVKKQSP